MDNVLWNFGLRYIQHLQSYNNLEVVGEEVIKSIVQLARTLDTRGRYSDAEAILKKMISDIETDENARFAEFAENTVRNMLESCPWDRYREARKMLAGFVPPLMRTESFLASTSRLTTRPAAPASSTSGNELGHQYETKDKAKAAPEDVGGDDGAPVLEIELGEEEDEGRFKPLSPHLRTGTIETTHRGVRFRCRSQGVVHGYLADGQNLASLLVYEFDFMSHRESARIKAVDIQFVYHSDNGGMEVLKIAPEGPMTLALTTQTKSTESIGVDWIARMGAEIGIRTERTMNRDTSDAVIVVPSIDVVDRHSGKSNASWKLREDPTIKLGVPKNIQVAILLRRADMDEFTGSLGIMATVTTDSAFRRALERLKGSSSNDDILYNLNGSHQQPAHVRCSKLGRG